jgi:outer membrane protein assembly factor BamB
LPVPLLPAEEAWNVSLSSPPSAQGALDESRAFIPLQSGEIVALNRETGASEWSISFASSWPPIVDEGIVYAVGDGELQAVRAATGDLIWRTPLDAELIAPPALQGSTLALLAKPDQLRALRVSDGSELWRQSLGRQLASPKLTAGAQRVVVASTGRISSVASSDGRLEWERELSGVLSLPLVTADRVFVGSTDNYFYALDAATGRLAWPRWRAGGDVVGAAADDRFVYVASLDNLLRALHRGSGNQVWRRNLTTRTVAPPSTFGGIVLLTGNTPTLSTFDATTGEPIANLSLPADLQGPPLVDSTLEPFRVAFVAVTREARAIGLRPIGMMFREPPLTPLLTLPGRSLNREPLTPPHPQSPAPTSQTSR